MTAGPNETYPARLTIDYPDRDLDRFSTLLRLIYVIPIAIVPGARWRVCIRRQVR